MAIIEKLEQGIIESVNEKVNTELGGISYLTHGDILKYEW